MNAGDASSAIVMTAKNQACLSLFGVCRHQVSTRVGFRTRRLEQGRQPDLELVAGEGHGNRNVHPRLNQPK